MSVTNSQIETKLLVSPSIYYDTLASKARRIVHQGGQWSGKTVNILAVLATKATQEKVTITVVGVTLTHLKGGALRDFLNYIYPYFKQYILTWNKTNNIFVFKSGSLLEFKSYEDETKARGAKRDYLFVNEANLIPWMTFFQLDSRTNKQTIIDYNPTTKFWAHDKLIGINGTRLFISDHRDNPFLTHEKHVEVENNPDPELWKVYARGMTGNVTGVIYPNWKRIPDKKFYDIVKDLPYGFAVDWGFTDPTAIVKVYYAGRNRYVEELEYRSDVPPQEVKQILMANGYNDNCLVFCDHNNKEAISFLRRMDIMAQPAIKGQGSINNGIQFINSNYTMYYNESSVNLHKERERYIWLKDRITGENTNTPIDAFNHLLDATRYFCYSHGAPLVGAKR